MYSHTCQALEIESFIFSLFLLAGELVAISKVIRFIIWLYDEILTYSNLREDEFKDLSENKEAYVSLIIER